ncbi:MAG TPA: hypothetical protein VFV38_29335 [Ktedonobacteraceae bacterium]|nr:hypothetical protein [Ktedonobacteraceae bacterium]
MLKQDVLELSRIQVTVITIPFRKVTLMALVLLNNYQIHHTDVCGYKLIHRLSIINVANSLHGKADTPDHLMIIYQGETIMQRVYLLPLGILLGLVMLFGIAYSAGASQLAPQSPKLFKSSLSPLSGKIGDTLATPEGVKLSFLAVEHHGTQVLFHINVHNTQARRVGLWNVDENHGFALYNHVTHAFEPIGAASIESIPTTYPALATTVVGQTDADGWIAFTVSSPSSYASTLYYYYQTVHTQRCSKPATSSSPIDTSKCQPAILYSTIHWVF